LKNGAVYSGGGEGKEAARVEQPAKKSRMRHTGRREAHPAVTPAARAANMAPVSPRSTVNLVRVPSELLVLHRRIENTVPSARGWRDDEESSQATN
jgi:hypothetical protein